MRIDVHGARLIARVDDIQEEVYLKGLNHDTNYGVSTNLPSVVLVGGKTKVLWLIFNVSFADRILSDFMQTLVHERLI